MNKTPAPADRRAAYDLVHAGIVAGLPLPHQINLAHDHLWLYVADRGGVDQWAAHLGLPAPVLAGSVYMTGLHLASRLPGWLVNVSAALPPAASARTESDR